MPDAAAATARWLAATRDLPVTPDAGLGAVQSLREANDSAACEAGLRALTARYPANRKIAVQHARSATQLGDWAEAVRRWSALHARLPGDSAITLGLAEALVGRGNPDAAEQLLADALREGAADADRQRRNMMVAHAELAARRGDAAAARERWQAVLQAWPGDPKAQAALRKAPDAGVDCRRDIMLRFESLGSSCEFGLVQRHFGAEPLGLFRWVSLRAPHLIEALRTDLAGIGEPEFTRMARNAGGHFITSDTRYRLQMHTFIKDTGQDRDAVFAQLRQRMVFLRRKLLEDLAAGEKIFVFRAEYRITRERILAIAGELQRYNANNRLAVVIAPVAGQPVFELGLLAPGVFCAAMPSGRIMPQGSGWKIDFPAWQVVCESASDALSKQSFFEKKDQKTFAN